LEHELKQFAVGRGYALNVNVAGVVTVPLRGDEPLTVEAFEALTAEEQAAIRQAGKEIEERTAAYAHQVRALEKEVAETLRRLEHDVAIFVTGPLFRELDDRFHDEPDVVDHLEDVKRELLENLDDFRDDGDRPLPLLFARERDATSRFKVNVLVENTPSKGAPVIVEENPTYYNLLGRLEYRAALGAMVTDFREIKPGALHRANGG